MKNLVNVALGGTDVNDPASREAAYKRVRDVVSQRLETLGVGGEDRRDQLDRLEREILIAESSMAFATAQDGAMADPDKPHAREESSCTDDQPDEDNAGVGVDAGEGAHGGTRTAIVQSLVKSIDKQIGADAEDRFAIFEMLRDGLDASRDAMAKAVFNSAELEAAIAEIELRYLGSESVELDRAEHVSDQPLPPPGRLKKSTASLKPADNRNRETTEPASSIAAEDEELGALLERAFNHDQHKTGPEETSGLTYFEDNLLDAFDALDDDIDISEELEQDEHDPTKRPKLAFRRASSAKTTGFLQAGMAVALAATALSIGITQWSGLVSAQSPDADMPHARIALDGKAGASEPALMPSPAANVPVTSPAIQRASLGAENASVGQQAVLQADNASAYFAMEGDTHPPMKADTMKWSIVRLPSASPNMFNPALYGQATIAELDLQVAVIVRHNQGNALDASHQVDVTFSGSGLNAMGGVQQLRGIVLQKDTDSTRQPLKGVAVQESRDAFRLDLQDTQAARGLNLDLLRHAGIMDIVVMLGNGRQAGIRLVLGAQGRRDLLTTLNFWSKSSQTMAGLSREPRSTEPVAPSSAGDAPISAKEAAPTAPSIRNLLRGPVPVPAQKPDRTVAVAMAR